MLSSSLPSKKPLSPLKEFLPMKPLSFTNTLPPISTSSFMANLSCLTKSANPLLRAILTYSLVMPSSFNTRLSFKPCMPFSLPSPIALSQLTKPAPPLPTPSILPILRPNANAPLQSASSRRLVDPKKKITQFQCE